jgi:hypothetical protein
MKDFINECLLFKSKDRQFRMLGVLIWICLILLALVLLFPDNAASLVPI